MQPNYVRVLLRCTRDHSSTEFCVRVERGVPDPIRCNPGGPVSSAGAVGGSRCSNCSEILLPGRLSEAVNERTRRGWADSIRDGAVVLDCAA